jgi:hypothetical protein
LEHLDIDGRIILKLMLRQWNVRVWSGIIFLGIGSSGGARGGPIG